MLFNSSVTSVAVGSIATYRGLGKVYQQDMSLITSVLIRALGGWPHLSPSALDR